ncbi:PhzF family phenazine biosynthesis protein [Gorillibacterium timonense]|uniref:PhzF family phenazine biosynthesis protein n=1 Tax=Gorillibacterium timonense TaxID=1689269 RepID=UPI00071D6CCC|nr:PhzF family phenazine biosynthesis isomerase [Gorillibacterium timonense]
MRTFAYRKVDAFTSGSSKGNPAAYLMTGDTQLTDEEMLAIGQDHRGFVSEVVFCSSSTVADVKLTYYSSECEVDFCGHGTVAAMYDYIQNDEALRAKSEITIETNKKGILTIYNRLSEQDSVFITAPQAEWLPLPVTKEEIADALGVSAVQLSSELPFDLIDAGLRTLIVPVPDFDVEVSVYPEQSKLKDFCIQFGIDIILLFCMYTSTPDSIAHTRVFAPRFGYLEDPATGSGNSAFANYMLKNELWDGRATKAEQGGDNLVYNSVHLIRQDGDILFGGGATVRIAGEYFVE